MPIDLKTLSPSGLTTIMSNARRKGGPEAEAARLAAAQELLEREQQKHPDPLAGACHGIVVLMDVCRREATRTNRKSMRTWNGIRNGREIEFMIRSVMQPKPGSGFKLLLSGGLGVYSFEYLIVANLERFPAEVVETAKARLVAHGIPLPRLEMADARIVSA